MEFVGLIGNFSEFNIEIVNKSAVGYGYKVIINKADYDSEITIGIQNFMEKMNCKSLLQFILTENSNTTYSNLITQNLSDDIQKSFFLEFLKTIKRETINLDEFYLVFASEWENVTNLIRFYPKSNLELVSTFFKLNSNWNLILFNCNNKSYQYEFEYPLIFEIV